MREKIMCEKSKTKLAESQFLKRSSCYSIKKKKMKKHFAAFITKPLKCKICPNFAAVNGNIKILHISAVFYTKLI